MCKGTYNFLDNLTDLICYAYDSNYYHNRLDTDTFNEMADAVIDAKMTVGDF